MSGKKIFITVLLIIIVLIGSSLVYQFQQYNFYKQFETQQQLQTWIMDSIKNKNKSKAKIPYCIEQTFTDYEKSLNSSFEVFWNNLITEDWSKVETETPNWSQAEMQDPKSGKNFNYTFIVKNIHDQKGEIGNRYFGLQPRYRNRFDYIPFIGDIFIQKYLCFEPNRFMNLDESYKWENPGPSLDK